MTVDQLKPVALVAPWVILASTGTLYVSFDGRRMTALRAGQYQFPARENLLVGSDGAYTVTYSDEEVKDLGAGAGGATLVSEGAPGAYVCMQDDWSPSLGGQVRKASDLGWQVGQVWELLKITRSRVAGNSLLLFQMNAEGAAGCRLEINATTFGGPGSEWKEIWLPFPIAAQKVTALTDVILSSTTSGGTAEYWTWWRRWL